jgi:hypothetical protein
MGDMGQAVGESESSSSFSLGDWESTDSQREPGWEQNTGVD